jgi:hypothetical protein
MPEQFPTFKHSSCAGACQAWRHLHERQAEQADLARLREEVARLGAVVDALTGRSARLVPLPFVTVETPAPAPTPAPTPAPEPDDSLTPEQAAQAIEAVLLTEAERNAATLDVRIPRMTQAEMEAAYRAAEAREDAARAAAMRATGLVPATFVPPIGTVTHNPHAPLLGASPPQSSDKVPGEVDEEDERAILRMWDGHRWRYFVDTIAMSVYRDSLPPVHSAEADQVRAAIAEAQGAATLDGDADPLAALNRFARTDPDAADALAEPDAPTDEPEPEPEPEPAPAAPVLAADLAPELAARIAAPEAAEQPEVKAILAELEGTTRTRRGRSRG